MKSSRLWTLPPELRTIIYENLILSQPPYEPSGSWLLFLALWRLTPVEQEEGIKGPFSFMLSDPHIFDEAWPVFLRNRSILFDPGTLVDFADDRVLRMLKAHCRSLILDLRRRDDETGSDCVGFAGVLRDAVEVTSTFPKLLNLEVRVDKGIDIQELGLESCWGICLVHRFPVLSEVAVRNPTLEWKVERLHETKQGLNGEEKRVEDGQQAAQPIEWKLGWRLELVKEHLKVLTPMVELKRSNLCFKKLVEEKMDERKGAHCTCNNHNGAESWHGK